MPSYPTQAARYPLFLWVTLWITTLTNLNSRASAGFRDAALELITDDWHDMKLAEARLSALMVPRPAPAPDKRPKSQNLTPPKSSMSLSITFLKSKLDQDQAAGGADRRKLKIKSACELRRLLSARAGLGLIKTLKNNEEMCP